MTKTLKPFWRYYGGKYRAAPHYPSPVYDIIIEPFAGAAGYSTRYHDRDIVLVEKYPVIAEMWRFLIGARKDDILSIPCVTRLEDLPLWVPTGARSLVGFSFNDATVSPSKSLSAGRIKLESMGRRYEGWNEARRQRTAEQVEAINHWVIIEDDYTCVSDIADATWFIDPPYNNKAGSHYVHSCIDYGKLADWCLDRYGQVIVCENEGADWLPFESFGARKSFKKRTSNEVVWTNNV